ncbi:MAG: class I SAM-dependent methyltransferase [Planctomycetes bacterium]|nr:class I SAM-dependent methyltransferase [Planctomycetota bacterium]
MQVCPCHHSVWDAGCGSGQAALDLSHFFETVQATDVSAAQIDHAPSCDGVTFSVQPAEATHFADASFDAVCVAQALHWFDHEQFWPEVQRVLRPGGIFAAWGYSWPHIDPVIDEVLDESFLAVIQKYWAPENKLLWDGYRDFPFPFERLESPKFELNMKWSAQQFFSYLHSWSATRRCIETEGDAFFEACAQKVNGLWGAKLERLVCMDFVTIAGYRT